MYASIGKMLSCELVLAASYNLQAPAIGDKFRTYPFVVMVVFSGAQPQSVTLPCDEFERLWERAAKADELE